MEELLRFSVTGLLPFAVDCTGAINLSFRFAVNCTLQNPYILSVPSKRVEFAEGLQDAPAVRSERTKAKPHC